MMHPSVTPTPPATATTKLAVLADNRPRRNTHAPVSSNAAATASSKCHVKSLSPIKLFGLDSSAVAAYDAEASTYDFQKSPSAPAAPTTHSIATGATAHPITTI